VNYYYREAKRIFRKSRTIVAFRLSSTFFKGIVRYIYTTPRFHFAVRRIVGYIREVIMEILAHVSWVGAKQPLKRDSFVVQQTDRFRLLWNRR